jgi:hypothetical protein
MKKTATDLIRLESCLAAPDAREEHDESER